MPDYYDKKPGVKTVVEKPETKAIIKEVNIRSLVESKLSYTGRVSGKSYFWSKAGDTVSVMEADVPDLLDKRLGKKSCCGSNDNKIFELA